MPDELLIRNMTRPEVDTLVGWAAREGWNPGLHDSVLFWATDPDAFIAAELDGRLIGGGAITAYGDGFGFMGFFIVEPEYRGRGLGDALWHARRERLIARLAPGATIGLDGVFNMQDYYAKGGFVFSHRNVRFRGEIGEPAVDGTGAGAGEILPLADFDSDALLAYDRACFPAPRAGFLQRWVAQPDHLALGCRRDGELAGYGVIRRCGIGCKIGPLFADDRAAAQSLFSGLVHFASGGPVFLDVPENNPAALELVRRHGMEEVFGCARMYLGPPPDLAHQRIFGVTTFELG